MRRTGAIWVVLGLGLLGSPQARADCVSDCSDAYQQAMNACQAKYSAPDQEIQLQDCQDDAQAQLGTCSDDCEADD